jgi:formylmethanofuran dehydrogenase subunit B
LQFWSLREVAGNRCRRAAVAHRLRDEPSMTETVSNAVGNAARWTCPFCPLLCDSMQLRANPALAVAELSGGPDCARARAGLRHFRLQPSAASPLLNGQPCSLEQALAAAARLLAASGQPLFGGLGTDVAGARALYRLACATGAICDPAAGRALMHGLRALQDRGGFSTTLAEMRVRADLIVCLGGLPSRHAPLFFERIGLGERARHIVLLGGSVAEQQALAALGQAPGVSVQSVPLQQDLFETMAVLAALLAGPAPQAAPAGLAALADRLAQARYAVLVGDNANLPEHGALLVEAANRIVGSLNRSTRAAALWLGGGNGASTVNQVFAWLSGLPLRSRAGPLGLEHEPLCFDAGRLLAEQAVDLLVWVSCFTPESAPPAGPLPRVVLGHPGLAGHCAHEGSVFIPVSTPGIGSPGHLFRTDGVVLLPLFAVHADGLPTLADVVGRLMQELVR